MEGELTLEQLQARLAAAEQEKAEALEAKEAAETEKAEALEAKEAAEAKVEELSHAVSASEEEKAKNAPVEFGLGDETYQFTCPTFTWDDGRVINVRKILESKDDDVRAEFAKMCQVLVERKSGIIRRKEK